MNYINVQITDAASLSTSSVRRRTEIHSEKHQSILPSAEQHIAFESFKLRRARLKDTQRSARGVQEERSLVQLTACCFERYRSAVSPRMDLV